MRWTCPTCTGELAREESRRVADSDGISNDATVTKWTCARCNSTFTHWLMPRAAMRDGKIVDASQEHWSPSQPTLVFDAPWHPVEDPSKLEAELAREIAEGHPLFGKRLRAIARHEACDDVLFASDDAVYVVHLTWVGHREPDPRWPTTTTYRSLAHFADQTNQG